MSWGIAFRNESMTGGKIVPVFLSEEEFYLYYMLFQISRKEGQIWYGIFWKYSEVGRKGLRGFSFDFSLLFVLVFFNFALFSNYLFLFFVPFHTQFVF